MALARTPRSGAEVNGSGTSGSVLPIPGGRLLFDIDGGTPFDLPPFPPFPERAEYNEGRADAGTLAVRGFRFAGDAGVAEASVVQVVFTNQQGRRWVVAMDPARATAGFTLPYPAPGFADRSLWNGATLPRSQLKVQTLRFARGGAPLSFAELVEWNEVNLDRADVYLTGFATVELP